MSRSLSCFSLWASVPLFLDCLLSAIWLTYAYYCTQTSSLRLESWVMGSYFLAPGLCVWSEPCTPTCEQLMELVYSYDYIHQLPYFISACLWTLLLYWRTLSYYDVILFSLRKQLIFVVICSIMISEFQSEKVNPLQIWLYINVRRKKISNKYKFKSSSLSNLVLNRNKTFYIIDTPDLLNFLGYKLNLINNVIYLSQDQFTFSCPP